MTTTDIQKWADKSMFIAEEETDEIVVSLPSATHDPMGVIAMGALGYSGRTITDLREITDAERRRGLIEMAKTILAAPTEFVSLHFVIEGIHRGLTHQMVRQRTAVYVQESMRFAVKADPAKATARPPSLDGTLSLTELCEKDRAERLTMGLSDIGSSAIGETAQLAAHAFHREDIRRNALQKGGAQANRIRWDDAADMIGKAYLDMINNGMPAEDARGILPTNVKTKIQYDTKLRGFLEQMSARVSDQAQFEWRQIVRGMVMAMRDFGMANTYDHWEYAGSYETREGDVILQYGPGDTSVSMLVRSSQLWQWREISLLILPPDFKLGRRAFGASMDRPSRIAERVDAFANRGVPSSKWLVGSPEHSIPSIHPDEWLLDPHSARLQSGQEFDIFGNRVADGEGWHWTPDEGGQLIRKREDGSFEHRRWPSDFSTDGEHTYATKDA